MLTITWLIRNTLLKFWTKLPHFSHNPGYIVTYVFQARSKCFPCHMSHTNAKHTCHTQNTHTKHTHKHKTYTKPKSQKLVTKLYNKFKLTNHYTMTTDYTTLHTTTQAK